MKNYFKGTYYQCAKWLIGMTLASFLFSSCDVYQLDNQEPTWLGASIYNYLKTDGHFTNYTKLIEDLEYTEVLGKTGSKTLFVANDSAFNVFFQKNDWGVTSYNQLTLAQKKLILNFGMINEAYLVDMLSNYNNGGLKEGAALRRVTAISPLDSLPFDTGDKLPASAYWTYYKTKGLYELKDNTLVTMIYFTQKQMDQAQISNEDFRIITGITRTSNDAHLFGIKIIKRDITCKNGYLNVLDKVLIPPVNMAEYINTYPNTSIFSSLIGRFCAPFFDASTTILYRQLHPAFTDSIFIKRYFAKIGGSTRYPSGLSVNVDFQLPFDPGWNSYTRFTTGNALQSDMAAMFVPSNEAMNNYFNSPAGAVLKDRFGSWDNVPTDILPLFIKRHMRTSFVESVPSKFPTMVDEDNSALPVSKGDIDKVYIGTNGVVYVTNKVYAPDDYISVYGPVLLSANEASTVNKTRIWNWAIVQNDFRLYLNSLVSRYSFFVPTDEYFSKYIDPIAINKDVPGAIKYWYNFKTLTVNATVYKFDKTTGQVGDSVAVIVSPTFLINRLLDLLNSHVVVGGVESGKNYYLTKGNVAVKVTGSGLGMTLEGGENMKLNQKVNVNKVYNQSNGSTYFIDKPIQSPLTSVYKVLSETPDFSAFFALLSGFPVTSSSVVFVNKSNYYGLDYNIKFFNTFNYTVYVPTNAAINKAIQDGLITPWESQGSIVGINDMTDATLQASAILNLEKFVRYHFQDNSVFVDNQSFSSIYQSATIKQDDASTHFGTFKNKYYRIGVNSTGGNLTLTTETNKIVNVVTSNGLYNIMTRDFVFNDTPSKFKNVDGTGSGAEFTTSLITTSSTAVIHQIDNVLIFK
ncbi:MAG: fasciclin domain-containing protein [Paludibacter sp.]|nr:fasciclin domain-containing protein [Paludibacter sp.]